MLKLFSAFAGYGTDNFALKELGIPYELIGFSEIDKYAVQCFIQNHGSKNYGDIKLINPGDLPDFDLFTGGFPCQSFSLAGKRLGELDPRGTLFYEIIRICEVKRPKFMLLENVKGLTSKKFKLTFEKILSELDRIGYNVYWEVLNTKDYGIPQSRSRVFFVCFRKDIDNKNFKFPEKEELKIFIKDILEENADEKYNLSPKLQERFKKYLEDKEIKICAMRGRNPENPTSRLSGLPTEQMIEVKTDGTSNTISTVQKDNLLIDQKTMITYDKTSPCLRSGQGSGNIFKVYDSHRVDEIREYDNESYTLSSAMGMGGNNVPIILTGLQEHQSIKTDGISNCLPGAMGEGGGHVPLISNSSPREFGFREVSPTLLSLDYKDPKIVKTNLLRKLTPKECFRLQGFLNDEINLDGLSDTQKYRLAGNGQSVNVVKKIFSSLLLNNSTEFGGSLSK